MKASLGLRALACTVVTIGYFGASSVQSEEQQNWRDVVDLFLNKCIEPLQTDSSVDVSSLVSLPEAELEAMVASRGPDLRNFKIWRTEQKWFLLVLKETKAPKDCIVSALNVNTLTGRGLWDWFDSRTQSRGPKHRDWPLAADGQSVTLRHSRVSIEHIGDAEFLHLSGNFTGPQNNALVVLRASRRSKSSRGCTHYPDVC